MQLPALWWRWKIKVKIVIDSNTPQCIFSFSFLFFLIHTHLLISYRIWASCSNDIEMGLMFCISCSLLPPHLFMFIYLLSGVWSHVKDALSRMPAFSICESNMEKWGSWNQIGSLYLFPVNTSARQPKTKQEGGAISRELCTAPEINGDGWGKRPPPCNHAHMPHAQPPLQIDPGSDQTPPSMTLRCRRITLLPPDLSTQTTVHVFAGVCLWDHYSQGSDFSMHWKLHVMQIYFFSLNVNSQYVP